MFKACSRCGKIHSKNYKCFHNKPKVDWSKYNVDNEEYKLRNTYKWHMKAEEIKKDAQYLCEVCRDKGAYNYNDIEVHHIVKVKEDASKLLDNYNLIALCIKHHKEADKGYIDVNYLKKLAKTREENK